ncbi:hypothetical protein SCHPADRAFT_1002207 [Schizopora paradoxa]|uniref:Uncharacterized protein n=1 Tax=Schizopora paradoxa TaxID=27342 RepID=A0A0H2R5R3_9AGAM|nr:hypothetical protein SCHPADRAFT_1002207 [Schizopora paradoxa]
MDFNRTLTKDTQTHQDPIVVADNENDPSWQSEDCMIKVATPLRATPISALPSEIIAQIFGLVVASKEIDLDVEKKGTSPQILYGANSTQAVTKRACVPLRLSHVCKRWMAIAIDSRILWTELYLRTDGLGQGNTNAREMSSLFARRSKSAPLFISIGLSPKTRSAFSAIGPETAMQQFEDIHQRALEEKAELLPELKSVKVHIVSGVLTPAKVFPLTEERYHWHYEVDGEAIAGNQNAVLSVEGRRRVRNFFNIDDYRAIGFAVTHLRLNDTNGMKTLSPRELYATIREMPMLENLVVHIDVGGDDEQALPMDVMEMKHLRVLDLSWDSDDTVGGQALDFINAPELEDLALAGDILEWETWDYLFNFLARPKRCNLKTLMLEHMNCTVIRMEECLNMMQSLTELTLEDCTFSDEILESLTRTNDLGSSVLSRLRCLCFITIGDCTGASLIRCIEKSQRDSQTLRKLYVLNCALVNEDHCDNLRELLQHCEEGDIEVFPSEIWETEESASEMDESSDDDLH